MPQPLEVGPSGKAYLEAIRYRGIETDVGYFDPTGAVPRLETGAPPPAPKKPPADGTDTGYSTSRILLILLVTTILAGLAVAILRSAGRFTLSFESEAQNALRGRRAGSGRGTAKTGPPADLRAILAEADRRRALVMLAQAALARTVVANGIILQPSWTMRDALRHIPNGQRHLEALRQLVLTGERVLFGDRDVTEAEFQAQVASVRPLMAEVTAA